MEEKKEKEKEEKGRTSKEAQEENRIQAKGVVEEVQRFHQKDLRVRKKKNGKERRKKRKVAEREREVECCENGKTVFPLGQSAAEVNVRESFSM